MYFQNENTFPDLHMDVSGQQGHSPLIWATLAFLYITVNYIKNTDITISEVPSVYISVIILCIHFTLLIVQESNHWIKLIKLFFSKSRIEQQKQILLKHVFKKGFSQDKSTKYVQTKYNASLLDAACQDPVCFTDYNAAFHCFL